MAFRKIEAGLVHAPVDEFIGKTGTIFYDNDLGDFRISDGATPGGIALSFGGGNGGNYTLPTASATVKGGVKIDGSTITVANQVISVGTVPYSSISGTPTIPTNNNQLTNGAAYITSSALSGYATENYVTGRGYITSSALTGYATESYVTNRGYITSSALTGLATESYVTSQGYITSSALTGLATESYVTTQGYITSAALSGYALTGSIPTDISDLTDNSGLLGQGGGGTTYITNNVENPYAFSIAGDDSTLREIANGESIKFTGAGGITIATDDEGNVTITGTTVDLTGYATLTGEETLTNKTLTSPTITDGVFQDTFTIGSQIFYEQGTNGFSVNEDFDIVGENNFTGYHFTSGADRDGVAFTLARTGQFTTGFGIHGTSGANEYVIGSETANTDFVFKNNIGMPFDVSGGSEIFRISKTGVLTVTQGETTETVATETFVTTRGYITSADLTGYYSNLSISDAAPIDKELWFNTIENRLYVKDNDTWVDANPQITQQVPTDISDLTDDLGLLQQSGGVSSWNDLTDKPTIPNLGKFVFDSDGDSAFISTTDDAGASPNRYDIVLVPGGEGNSSIRVPSQANSLAGFPLIIEASAANSAVVINTENGNWTFGADGDLTVPGNIVTNSNLSIGVVTENVGIFEGSLEFVGSGTILLSPGVYTGGVEDTGTTPFTIDVWVRFSADPATHQQFILGTTNDNYNGLNLFVGDGQFTPSATKITIDCKGVGSTTFDVPTITTDTWYHIAVAKNSSGNGTVWVNGVRSLTGSIGLGYAFTGFTTELGSWSYNNSTQMLGNLGQVRIVSGDNLYDPNEPTIEVPTADLQTVTGTQLLLLMRSADQYGDDAGNNTLSVYDMEGSITLPTWTTDAPTTDIPVTWTFGTDGGLTFPDATVQTTAWTGTTLSISNTAPTDKDFWYNTTDGRLYLKDNSIWVDASPQIPQQVPTDISDLTDDLGLLQQSGGTADLGKFVFDSDGDSAFITTTDDAGASPDRYDIVLVPGGEGYASIRVPNYTNTLAGDPVRISNMYENGSVAIETNSGDFTFNSNGKLTLPNGSTIGDSDAVFGVPITTTRGSILIGNQAECIGGENHFHIMKGGQQAIDLFLGDDSNYVKLPTTGGVDIASQGEYGTNTWKFSTDGVLRMPDGNLGGDGRIDFNFEGYNWGRISSHNRQVYIQSLEDNGEYPPEFGKGALLTELSVGLDVVISTNVQGTGSSSIHSWKFGTDGILNLPNNNGQIGQLTAPYTGLEFRTGSGADWIGISYGEINDNNTSYFYFDKDGSDYTTANHRAHLQIKSPEQAYGASHLEWLFDADGNLTIPHGGKLGFDLLAKHEYGAIALQSLGGVGTYAAIASPYSFVQVRDNEVEIQSKIDGETIYNWTFGADGGLTFPDNTVQYTAWQGSTVVSDTAPEEALGRLWYNTTDGRTYVRYNDTWVDASPQIPQETFSGDYNDLINIPEATLADRLVAGSKSVILGTDGLITFPEIDGVKTLWGAVDEDFSIRTTRTDPGSDADIDIYAADDLRLYAEGDELELHANSNVSIHTDTANTNYQWTFGDDGNLTIPGNIRKTTDASIVVGGGGSPIENVEVNAVDEWGPPGGPGGVWRLFIGVDAYPTLGTTVQIGDTVTTSWGTPITATIVDIQQDDDWKIHVDQDITAGHNDYDTVTFTPASGKTWTFGTDGVITLPNSMTIDASIVFGIVRIGGDKTRIEIDNGGAPPGFTITTSYEGTSVDPKNWRFGPDGDLTFPDATVQTTAWTGTTLSVSSSAPTDKDFWYNTTDGRLYLKDNSVWVDASPQIPQQVPTDISDLTDLTGLLDNTGSGITFQYSRLQEGITSHPITSITGLNETGLSLTSNSWAQLMWVPDITTVTLNDIDDGGDTYNWAYTESGGFIVENKYQGTIKSWQFNRNGTTDFPNYTFPSADGAANQVLKTDGNGNLTWTDQGATPDRLTSNARSATLNSNGTFSLPTLTAAPADPQAGQMALADGVSWNPLSQTGTSPYMVIYTGTGWLGLGGGVTMDQVYGAILELGTTN